MKYQILYRQHDNDPWQVFTHPTQEWVLTFETGRAAVDYALASADPRLSYQFKTAAFKENK